MTKKIICILLLILSFFIGYLIGQKYQLKNINQSISKLSIKTYPLKKYSIPNLKKTEFEEKQIEITKEIDSTDEYLTYRYYSYNDNKKVSGLINIPKQAGEYPITILLRGYVDKEIYSSGIGTQRVGEFLAQNGYITIAPDFLGYGKSDKEAKDGLEARFQTYTTVLELFASLNSINTALGEKELFNVTADVNRVGIWAHSNGGHIALTTLAISGKKYPTVLWAPVSKPFPYSILFYTDQYTDRGKYLRKLLADFETDYNIEKYNPANYYQWIKAPIQIHQGTADQDVPINWSNDLDDNLRELHIDVEYFTYDEADHNLLPDAWSSAVVETLEFFNLELPKN